MKELVSKDALAKALKVKKANPILALLSSVAKINQLNNLYAKCEQSKGTAFIDAIFNELNVAVSLNDKELELIPETGPCIVVCNHPFGALDGLATIKVLSSKRPDVRVMANFLLQKVEPISEFFYAVNPFEGNASDVSSSQGLKQCIGHLKNGGCLVIFPAGEVSTMQGIKPEVSDRKWHKSAIKLIQKSKVPIVPMYFDGRNSYLFHLLGKINPAFRTLRLPAEFLKKKNHPIAIRIGKPISPQDQELIEDTAAFGRFLRAKVYALGTDVEVHRRYFKRFSPVPLDAEPVAEKKNNDLIIEEIRKAEDQKLFEHGNFSVFALKAASIPNLLNEIGRQRELTFRAVGEGTNRSLDLDEYDLYYYHLVLWDNSKQQLAGAYRLGIGSEIMKYYGRKGFYTSSLFKMKKQFAPILDHSMEMGRSFVAIEYQRQRWPLFLLWQGILCVLQNFKQIKYIIGPVTISNDYKHISKELLVKFVENNYFDKDLAKHIKPRTPFKFKDSHYTSDDLLLGITNDIKKLDKLISEIEPMGNSIPILLKKYLAQNAKILCFNRDPEFNDALDAFMILDIEHMSEDLQLKV
jgi:putative hemolysin